MCFQNSVIGQPNRQFRPQIISSHCVQVHNVYKFCIIDLRIAYLQLSLRIKLGEKKKKCVSTKKLFKKLYVLGPRISFFAAQQTLTRITEQLFFKAAYPFEVQTAQVWDNHNAISSCLLTLNKRHWYKQFITVAYVQNQLQPACSFSRSFYPEEIFKLN